MEKYCDTEEESHNAENEIKDANKAIFMEFQSEHPEFTVCFKFKKFVVPGPATNEAMRTNDFEKVPTVDFISKVDLLHVAREYLMYSLGCTTAAQLMAVHENAMYTIISFARSLLAVTKDYLDVKPEGSELDIGYAEAAFAKDKAHLQMFFVTTNKKDIRPVAAGNVAGLFGVKKELPPAPEAESISNTAFVGKLHEYFDSQAQKDIAAKMLIWKRDYDNGLMNSTGKENDIVNETLVNETAEEPSAKRLRFTFGEESSSDSSDI